MVEALRLKGKMVNRFPGIHGLAHKDYYSRLMRIAVDIDEEAAAFMPRQFTFPAEREAFLEYHKGRKGVYIAKPVAGSEGNNIILFRE